MYTFFKKVQQQYKPATGFGGRAAISVPENKYSSQGAVEKVTNDVATALQGLRTYYRNLPQMPTLKAEKAKLEEAHESTAQCTKYVDNVLKVAQTPVKQFAPSPKP